MTKQKFTMTIEQDGGRLPITTTAALTPAQYQAVLAIVQSQRTDADIIEWLERNHTLHRAVEALYVVDGYQVTITHDDHQIAGPWRGETLREAYVRAMGEWSEGSWR